MCGTHTLCIFIYPIIALLARLYGRFSQDTTCVPSTTKPPTSVHLYTAEVHVVSLNYVALCKQQGQPSLGITLHSE